MNDSIPEADRKEIARRFAFSILFLIFFEIIKTIVQVAVVFQFVFLLITQRHNEPVRKFCNKLSAYAYKTLRYATLNENEKPFPFAEITPEIEPSEPHVRYK